MKSFMKIVLFIQVLFFSKNVPGQAQKAKIPTPVQQMMHWQGQWEGPVTLQLDGKTSKSVYYADFKKTADGNGFYMDESCDIPGVGKLKGANLIGYDPNDGNIHWFSVDNMGTTHEHTGQFINNNDFHMEHKSLQQGKQYIEKIDVNLKGKNTMWVKITATLDGNVQEEIQANFTRKGRIIKNAFR